MKFNYNNDEIGTIVKKILPKVNGKLQMRINKSGNVFFEGEDEKFVLYKLKNGNYIWRRHSTNLYGYDYCYPLNMVGRKEVGHIKSYPWSYRPFNTSMAEIFTIEGAIDYFINYLTKFKSYYLK